MQDSEGGAFEHVSVLLEACIRYLNPKSDGIYVDGTLGGGGHASAILEAAPGCTVIGIDRDPSALKAAGVRLSEVCERTGGQFHLVHGTFAGLSHHLSALEIEGIDGFLVDLGVSSHQLDVAERGFSFRMQGPLDMRMDPTSGQSAAELLAELELDEMTRIFRDYGEERHARAVARAIVQDRDSKAFTTTRELAGLVERIVGRKSRGKQRIHPATRVFQALRIAVNGELDQVEQVLPQAVEALNVGGRMAVISFHSLEDRIVKKFMRQQASGCDCPPDFPICVCGKTPRLKILTRKPHEPSEQEVLVNTRARSSKLRVAEKC